MHTRLLAGSRDHFIDALPDSDVRLRIREIQAKDVAEAEILALRLEAYRVTDRKKTNRYRGCNRHVKSSAIYTPNAYEVIGRVARMAE
jgi:hypothetical protein